MSEYNQMQEVYRERCKERIGKQLMYGETQHSAFQLWYWELGKQCLDITSMFELTLLVNTCCGFALWVTWYCALCASYSWEASDRRRSGGNAGVWECHHFYTRCEQLCFIVHKYFPTSSITVFLHAIRQTVL